LRMSTPIMRQQAPSLRRLFGLWKDVPIPPIEPILGLNEEYHKCTNPNKVNLTIGIYRDDYGNPFVLPCIKVAKKILHEKIGVRNDYLSEAGDEEFLDLAIKLAYGEDSKAVKEKRVARVQTLSGTGGCFTGIEFIRVCYKQKGKAVPTVYCTQPTWPVHPAMIESADLQLKYLRYYCTKTRGLDFEGLIEDIQRADEGSVFLLHACAHNPTGVDPTPEQWNIIVKEFQKKNHLVFFDMAYQGFASGELQTDNYPIRLWQQMGIPFMLSQSFAKSLGLYGHRTGTFSICCESTAERDRIQETLEFLTLDHQFPPRYGSDLAKIVLSDEGLMKMWQDDLHTMAWRIRDMRQDLVIALTATGSPYNWSHLRRQIGMFAFTGLEPKHVEHLIKHYSIYLVYTGRVSMSGLNMNNVQYVAQCFHETTQKIPFTK